METRLKSSALINQTISTGFVFYNDWPITSYFEVLSTASCWFLLSATSVILCFSTSEDIKRPCDDVNSDYLRWPAGSPGLCLGCPPERRPCTERPSSPHLSTTRDEENGQKETNVRIVFSKRGVYFSWVLIKSYQRKFFLYSLNCFKWESSGQVNLRKCNVHLSTNVSSFASSSDKPTKTSSVPTCFETEHKILANHHHYCNYVY